MKISVGPVVVLGDLHCPFVDQAAFKVCLQVIQLIGPKAVVINGDAVDNYALSRFDKDPERVTSLGVDLDVGRQCLREIRGAAPESALFYTEGNHEARLSKVKCRIPELSCLPELTIPALLRFKELGITWVGERDLLTFGDWVILHGSNVNAKGGYTGQRMIDRYGCSGVSNHVHRLAQVSRTVYGRAMTWIENGHLCDPAKMEYGSLFDWQQGFSVLRRGGREAEVYPELVQIKDGQAWYHGQLFTAQGGS